MFCSKIAGRDPHLSGQDQLDLYLGWFSLLVSVHAKCLTQSRLITLLPSLIARQWVGRQTQ